jgi:taurine dioxygenase
VVFGSDDTYPEIYSVAKHRTANRHQGQAVIRPWSGWHADITAAINPPAASILRGAIVPPYGGDTQWTNLAAAYNSLSPTLRGFLDGLRGIHRFAPPPGVHTAQEYDELIRRKTLVSEHPLIRVHPETGERVLYVSPSFLKSIVGLTPRESQHLLELLWEHAVRPEFTVRFKWEPGSMAFWDNRATAHLAPTDIFDVDFDRQFYRITLVGDIPVGVDGSPSRALEGEPIVAV